MTARKLCGNFQKSQKKVVPFISVKLLTIIFLFSVTIHLDAQTNDKQQIFLEVESGDYNSFSAMQDEAGVKVDVYRSYSTTPVAKDQERIHFIEAWTATEAWKALSDQEQRVYLESLVAPIENILAGGVEIISWGVNNLETDQRADYDFFATWSFPSQESVRGFEQAVASSNWYKYFLQVNMSGEASTPPAVMEFLIAQ